MKTRNGKKPAVGRSALSVGLEPTPHLDTFAIGADQVETIAGENEGDTSSSLELTGWRGWFLKLALRFKDFDPRFEFEVFCLKIRILHLKFRHFLLERSQCNLSRRLDVLEASSHRGTLVSSNVELTSPPTVSNERSKTL